MTAMCMEYAMLAEIFMLRAETAAREASEGRGAVRADHVAVDADSADDTARNRCGSCACNR